MPSPSRARAVRLPFATLFAAALAIALSGCLGGAPAATESPEPTALAIFESDEQALAAAKTALAAYDRTSDAITAAGGAEPERMEAVATGRELEESLDYFAKLASNQWRTTGALTSTAERIADRWESDGRAHVAVYMCADVSDQRLVDAAGTDVTPERPDVQAYAANLVSAESGSSDLIVESSDRWTGEDFCS